MLYTIGIQIQYQYHRLYDKVANRPGLLGPGLDLACIKTLDLIWARCTAFK